jgi:hypothetical protein
MEPRDVLHLSTVYVPPDVVAPLLALLEALLPLLLELLLLPLLLVVPGALPVDPLGLPQAASMAAMSGTATASTNPRPIHERRTLVPSRISIPLPCSPGASPNGPWPHFALRAPLRGASRNQDSD